MRIVCKGCGSGTVEIFYKLKNVPVQSVLNIADRKTALEFTTGEISLTFCKECGFISNIAFEPELLAYETGYEATQSYSATFSEFARRQAEQLIRRYDLHGKNLLEIGCGNGEFLSLLCEMGGNRGVGFDPAYVEGRVKSENGSAVKFIKEKFSEEYSDCHADFLYCKMTFEHIHNISDFLQMVRSSIKDRFGTAIFFQVPDVTRILKACAFEDIYYEHCSYFSPGSLTRLFQRCGFSVNNVETDYQEQYVMIDAKPMNDQQDSVLPKANDLEDMKKLVAEFPHKVEQKHTEWRDRIDRIKSSQKRAVIWGSGSKGVTFLTTLGITDEIQYAVDINPFRQGTFMAGTGHKIVSPEFLREYRPHVVIAMNAVYTGEIGRDLANLGLNPEILAL